MAWRYIVAILVSSVMLLDVQGQPSCQICSDHIMCLHPNSQTGPACGSRLGRGVSSSEQDEILHAHNTKRNTIALDEELRGAPGPQPAAANMMKMVWNPELATMAQRAADQCVFQHDCCRKTKTYQFGQNIYMAGSTKLSNSSDWQAAVNAWYNEVALFDKQSVDPFRYSSGIGHYTQLVWAYTVSVGCGYTRFKKSNDRFYRKIYFCNYGPTGNWISGSMYKQGTACSQCPDSFKCDSKYAGLCSK